MKVKNRSLRTWCKANKMTLKELAETLHLPYQAIIQISSKRSKSLKNISLVHAYTLLPLEVLLPSTLRSTVKKMREFKGRHPTRKTAKARRKLFIDSHTFPQGSLWEITYEDSEIVRLECNEHTIHIPPATFDRFFREVPL